MGKGWRVEGFAGLGLVFDLLLTVYPVRQSWEARAESEFLSQWSLLRF
jgi:hypothetical protein